jgi:uncharacterized membrane protein
MIKNFIIILIILLVIDLPVILGINNKMYKELLLKINNEKVKFTTKKVISGLITYILLAFSIYWFIIKEEKGIIDSALLGLIIYGTYNGTNLATIKKWGIKESIFDTLWGSVLYGLSTFIFSKINTMF